ncbi:MAG: prepilin-type N-terminal cleavage/methylation domain-containing protein [Candidatus Paceibacteria bacterium]
MKKIPKNIHNNHAFSLVEVLVAITILLLVVVTPMGIVSQANNSTAFANEQLIAFFLAQEGLEIVEKGRNDLYLQHFVGSGGITNPMNRFRSTNTTTNVFGDCINRDCGVQIGNNGAVGTVIRCTSINNCRLYYDANNSRSKYVHVAGTPSSNQITTLYTRKIRMEPVVDGSKLQEMKVTSTVTWRTGSLIAGQQVELVTYLANIYDTN